MADRYWVPGGTNTWSSTNTGNWSASSGGVTGASVPTVADNVIFDQAGTYSVTMTGALACLDITVSAGTVTFAASGSLNVRGSMSLLAGTVWNSTGTITFTSTSPGRTVTTNGVAIPGASGSVIFNGVGGEWTLGSALTGNTSVSHTLTAGTLKTNGYTLTGFSIVSSGSLTRVFDFGSSTINPLTTGSCLSFSGTNLTVIPGTSQINVPGSISSPGVSFYNVAFTSTTAGTRTITGSNTFNNLAVTGPASAGVNTVTFDSQQTINGTLSTTGTAGNRRVWFRSATYGISVDLVHAAPAAYNAATTYVLNDTVTYLGVIYRAITASTTGNLPTDTTFWSPALVDADFRGIYVRGTAAPISGTRIGNRGECRGITFSTPKTVYWNLSGAQNWSANAWATTSTGTPSTDNFPLPQDTATFTNAGSVTNTISLDGLLYISTIDMSQRTAAMFIGTSTSNTVYGNWINGSGTNFTGSGFTLTFSGGSTQTIDSAGKTFLSPITVDTYGGTVQLSGSSAANGALNIGTNALTVTNGTFDTKNYNVSAGTLSSNFTTVRTITLGSSTLSFITAGVTLSINATNLSFNAGTSNIIIQTPGNFTPTITGSITFYNFTIDAPGSSSFSGSNTFNNLTVTAPNFGAINILSFEANQTINGTLTCAGASAVRRVFLRSNTIGTQRTLTVNSISATDCDFRDINLAGAASGASPTRAGNCGGNSGITFPAPKTVYWNLAGAQNWSATGWATSSGGSPAVNNFPLAQDTAVFDNTGTAGTITIDATWNIGTFDASLRTSAMTFTANTNQPFVYGNWLFGTGVTRTGFAIVNFCKNGTQTITSNGVAFSGPITVDNPFAVVQLADALTVIPEAAFNLTRGTFDAVTYNVTTGGFVNGSTANTLRMGSGTWTLSGTGTVWNVPGLPTLIVGTSTIVLSDTSTTARTFSGSGGYYNKLTIGGTTGTSTLTITGANTFGELASTKTVAHTITFLSGTITTIGKWAVTGTVGNVVTVNSDTAATAFFLSIAGPANSGIDYLSVRDCTVLATSPGEFYVGANSTNVSGNTRVIFTATPAPRTLYWVGGTGNWSDTNRWSTSSGIGSGAAIPTSLDAVIFDSASNATGYTATIDAGVTLARCASFTMAGPQSGNVTFAGTVGIAFHGNVSFAATGITRTYLGSMQWAGNSSYTFTTNGVTLSSTTTVTGIGCEWTLGSPHNNSSSSLTITYGSFKTNNYALTSGGLFSSNNNIRGVDLGASTINMSGGVTLSGSNLTFNAGTSSITLTGVGGINVTQPSPVEFYNVTLTYSFSTSITTNTNLTFNNLTRTSIITNYTGINFTPGYTYTVKGTFTFNAPTDSIGFLNGSGAPGATINAAAVSFNSGTEHIAMRYINAVGPTTPWNTTPFGDAGFNSGITFAAPRNVYWVGGNGSLIPNATNYAASNGGTPARGNYPRAQDTLIFNSNSFSANGQTISISFSSDNVAVGTLDFTGVTRPFNFNDNSSGAWTMHGSFLGSPFMNWTAPTTNTSTPRTINMFTRGVDINISMAGNIFYNTLVVNAGGTDKVKFLDTFTQARFPLISSALALTHQAGVLDFNGQAITVETYNGNVTANRSIVFGSGTGSLTIFGSSTAFTVGSAGTGFSITGNGTISLTSASSKTFTGGGVSYTNITLNQGGAGTLTISGNNTFKDITNTYSATGATTIALGNTTQTVTQFTGTGAVGKVLTISGTSAASPGTLIMSGAAKATTSDYLTISNVRAYSLADTWYAGANSTNNGSLGWYFQTAPALSNTILSSFFFLF